MASWISNSTALSNPIAWLSLAAAAGATFIILWFLVKRPALSVAVKLALLFGIAVLPIGSAVSGNIVGFSVSTQRTFCASCHVMEPWTEDSANRLSDTLASAHARNPWFGKKNCYTCHTNYGMFGTVATKAAGLKHVFVYFMKHRNTPLDEALQAIEIYEPFQNQACMQCHSTEAPAWDDVPDHKGATDDVRAEEVSCASEGCHGPAHPYSKEARLAKESAHE